MGPPHAIAIVRDPYVLIGIDSDVEDHRGTILSSRRAALCEGSVLIVCCWKKGLFRLIEFEKDAET